MSVDTYLQGKNTSRYSVLRAEDVKVLINPRLAGWRGTVSIDTRTLLFWRRFAVDVLPQECQGGT